MKKRRFIGLALLLILLVCSGEPGMAQNSPPPGNIQTNPIAPFLLVAGGGFACGPDITCNPASQYCNILIGGPKGVPPGYECVDVAGVGPGLTCDTIPDPGIGCECTEADGGVTVTCTAP
jgi:hypothetical protein